MEKYLTKICCTRISILSDVPQHLAANLLFLLTVYVNINVKNNYTVNSLDLHTKCVKTRDERTFQNFCTFAKFWEKNLVSTLGSPIAPKRMYNMPEKTLYLFIFISLCPPNPSQSQFAHLVKTKVGIISNCSFMFSTVIILLISHQQPIYECSKPKGLFYLYSTCIPQQTCTVLENTVLTTLFLLSTIRVCSNGADML